MSAAADAARHDSNLVTHSMAFAIPVPAGSPGLSYPQEYSPRGYATSARRVARWWRLATGLLSV
jgi:hypothetical protein